MGSWQVTAQYFLFAQCVLSIYLSHPWKQSGGQSNWNCCCWKENTGLNFCAASKGVIWNPGCFLWQWPEWEIRKHYLLAEGAAQFPFQPTVIPLPWLNMCTGKGLLIDSEICLWSLHFSFYSIYICKGQGRKAKSNLFWKVFSILTVQYKKLCSYQIL